jgi:hypothetical protein
MHIGNLSLPRFLLSLLWPISIPIALWAQTPASQDRILEKVNEGALVTLRGNTHPLAQSQFDQGAAPPDLPMARMLLVLKRSDAQESALRTLLDEQQDLNSPSYHQWLTPDDFGKQFGPSDQDMQSVAGWLISHGFQVAGISRGRTVIEFSGSASQVQQAFHTEIHKYIVNGESHWANASDPQIPAALAPVINGINSLHNFSLRPAHRVGGVFSKSRLTGKVQAIQPAYTVSCGSSDTCYFVGPYDFATIYNVTPLWNATPAIDGTGQTIAIVNESNINLQDIRDFRSLFGLAPNDPQVIIDGSDPGLVPNAETEADLDVEWSGAVAKGATVKLVIAASTDSTPGVELAAVYAVENNTAPIISESFLQCELFLGAAGNTFENAIREQAAAQGITYINASGDEGAAGCDYYPGSTPAPAKNGLMVNGLASSPYGVAVGGTDFQNFGPTFNFQSPSPYWNPTNDTHEASALGYVPETTWNSTCVNNIFVVFKYGSTPEASCNNQQASNYVETLAGGGGKSNCITSNGFSCLGGYPKPAWQVSPGVPQDGARDVPDVSLFASGGFMNSAYIVCESDQSGSYGSCGATSQYAFLTVGGTSASAPAFAGIMAMVNQFTKSLGQGNANYDLYKLASSNAQKSSNCNATGNPQSTCIFHDVTSGTIEVPCAVNTLNCTVSSAGDAYGVLTGYNASIGYDLATGLGSVNAYNLVHGWNPPTIATTTTLGMNNGAAVNITHGQSVPVTINVSPTAATGDVVLIGSPSAGSSVEMGSFTLQNGAATGSTTALAGGTSYQVTARYAGDAEYAPSESNPFTVTVTPEPSKTLITIPVFDPTTGKETGNTPPSVAYGSAYIVRMDVANTTETVTFPMKPLCPSLGCPTGSVTLTDSVPGGASGVFLLDEFGVARDYSVQLAGGVHQLIASYPGDSSYTKNSGSYSLTVTPAPTQTLPGNPPLPPSIVTPFGLSAIIQTKSSGVMPSCNVTFFEGSTPVPGTVTCNGQNGGPTWGAFLQPYLTITTTTLGSHTYTAKFNGDSNYAPSTGVPETTSIIYGTALNMSVDKTTVQYGQGVTLTAIVDTFQNSGPPISHAVSFFANGATPVPGTVTYTPTKDSSGNVALQATFTITPQSSVGYYAIFAGDANYNGSASSQIPVTVNIPGFTVADSPPSITVVAGLSGTATVTVTPATNSSSPVTLSCATGSLPAGAVCSFSPQTVTLSNGTPATSTLTLATLPPSNNTTASATVLPHASGPFSGPSRWRGPAILIVLTSILLFILPRASRRYRIAMGLASAFALTFLLSCGAGSGNGTGGGGGGNVQVPTSIALTTSEIKVSAGGTNPTIQAKVTSSRSVTGTVTFVVNGTFDLGANVSPDGTATMPGFPGSIGTNVITASYAGDPNNLPSQTVGTLDEVITGTAYMSVIGTTGGLNSGATVVVNVQ